jgi:hypothetical protein
MVRHSIPALLAVASLGLAGPAAAAPTCEDRAGETVRCEDPRAMPVGWTAPLEARLKREAAEPPSPTPVELGGVFVLIGLLFTLIALMPDFDGWGDDSAHSSDEDEDGRRGGGR